MASIVNTRSVNDPQRAYEFEVSLFGTNSLPILTERVQNVTIPEKSVETIEINFKSSKTIYAGRDASPHTVIVTFWEDESNSLYAFFSEWMDRIRRPDGSGGETRDLYNAEMLISRLMADSTTVSASNRLSNVFITSLGDVSLSYESSEHMTFDVTFSYDENTAE